MDKMQDEQMIH